MGELRRPHLGNLSSYMPCKWQSSWSGSQVQPQHLCYTATLMTPRAAAGTARNKNLSFFPGGPAVRSKHLGLLLSLSDIMNFKKSTQRQSDHLRPNWDFPGFSTEGPMPKMLPQTWAHRDNWSPYREVSGVLESQIHCSEPWSSFTWRPSLDTSVLLTWSGKSCCVCLSNFELHFCHMHLKESKHTPKESPRINKTQSQKSKINQSKKHAIFRTEKWGNVVISEVEVIYLTKGLKKKVYKMERGKSKWKHSYGRKASWHEKGQRNDEQKSKRTGSGGKRSWSQSVEQFCLFFFSQTILSLFFFFGCGTQVL